MSHLTPYIAHVEEYLRSLGLDPAGCATRNPNEWAILKNGVLIVLTLRETQTLSKPKQDVFIVMAPIVKDAKDPAKSVALLRYLMEVNHGLIAERFTLYEDGWISLVNARPVEGLDAQEVEMAAESLCEVAAFFKKEILDKYGLQNDPMAPETDDDSSAR